MGRTYFIDSDNFKGIIQSHFSNIKGYSQVQTGWTNYVYRVETESGVYYFRFPRNEFFSGALIKEYNMVQFVKDKISFITPEFELYYHGGKPYTIHPEIEGESLSECYTSLSLAEKQTLAQDVCKLLKEFENINISGADNFQSISNFLDNLSLVSQNNYDLAKHDHLKQLEKEKFVFSHGDFNPGNLILKNHKLVAVIDFSFSGISNGLVDVSRLIGRCPSEFAEILILEYEHENNKSISKGDLDSLLDLWAYVEEKYILYIKQNHPSIILPTLV